MIRTSVGIPESSNARNTTGTLRTQSPHQSAERIKQRKSSRLLSDAKNSRSSSLLHSNALYHSNNFSLFLVIPSINCWGEIPLSNLSDTFFALIDYPPL